MDLRQKILLACVKKKRQKNSRKYGKTHRTLLANDCTGGVILHDLGMEFDTPTINLWMGGHDFIKYVSHLREYNLSPLVNYDEKKYCNGNTIIVQEGGG